MKLLERQGMWWCLGVLMTAPTRAFLDFGDVLFEKIDILDTEVAEAIFG